MPRPIRLARKSAHAKAIDASCDALPRDVDRDAPWVLLLAHADGCGTCRAGGKGAPESWVFCGLGRRLLEAHRRSCSSGSPSDHEES